MPDLTGVSLVNIGRLIHLKKQYDKDEQYFYVLMKWRTKYICHTV